MVLSLTDVLPLLLPRGEEAGDGPAPEQPPLVIQVYTYIPNKGAAYLFAVISGLLAIASITNVVRYRNWWALVLPIGATAMTGGYVTRVLLSKYQDSLGLLIVEQVLVICSPAAYLAFNYIIYGRLITSCFDASFSKVNPRRVSTFFVISDLVTFFVQVTGASMGDGNTSKQLADIGHNIFIGGLVAQLVSYLLYCLLVINTHKRVKKGLPSKFDNLRKFFIVLYISSGLIVIRCIYRVTEGVTGFEGVLFTHEAPFYVLDAVPLVIAMWIYNIPGRLCYWPGAIFEKFRNEEGDTYFMEGLNHSPA